MIAYNGNRFTIPVDVVKHSLVFSTVSPKKENVKYSLSGRIKPLPTIVQHILKRRAV